MSEPAIGASLVRDVSFLPASAEQTPSVVVPEAQSPVSVDGKLDEPAWGAAAVIDRFVLWPTGFGDKRRASVHLLFDRHNIYVGMRLYGDDMQSLSLVPQKKTDTYGGHIVEMWFDPTGQGKSGVYQVCVNAIGTRYDESPRGPAWQGTWQGTGSVAADHWAVEVAFPFEDVGLEEPPIGRAWLANFARAGERSASWTGGWGAARLARVFFGNDGTRRAGRKPRVSLILDREEYDPLDVTGVALIKIDRGSNALRNVRLRVELLTEAGAVIQRHEISRLTDENLDVTVNTGDMPLGEHQLRAVLTDAAGQPLASASAPLRKLVKRKQRTEPDRQRVPIRVWPAVAAAPATWPVTTGVPFPQGMLANARRVRLLDDRDREVPCQTIVRSRWNRHGTVRWLGLDFPARLAKGGSKYTLEFGREIRRGPPRQGLTIDESAGHIRVNTGPLQFTVLKNGFNLLDEVRLHGKIISRQDARAGLDLTDHQGAVYRAANDPDVEVAIEEAGPLKVVIRAAGWYVKDGTKGDKLSPTLPTDRLCQHVTRLTAYAGEAYVKVQHVLVITCDTHKVRLRHVGISQQVEGARDGLLAMDGKAHPVSVAAGSTRLYQPSSRDAQIETGVPDSAALRIIAKGKRADGWCRLSGPNGALAMCVTDLWQLFPKELEIAGGRLGLNVWPRHGRVYTGVDPLAMNEVYKLWWCHTGKELNFTMPAAVYDALIESPEAKSIRAHVENGRIANAQGVAVESNLLLWFHSSESSPADARALNATYQYGPHACADPRWICDSGAFGPMTPRDETQWGDVEAFFDHAVSIRLAAQEFARDYGQFNWQEIHSDNSHFGNGRWSLNRVWNQGHHGSARIPWILYARSGEPKYLRFGRRLARHVMNVDVTHYVTRDYDLFSGFKRPRWPNLDHSRGAMFHVKGFQHWGGDSVLAGHLINYDHMIWDYYLTGNHRGLEVALEWADGIKQFAPRGYSGREGTMTIAELVELYRATWDVGLLEVLDAFAARIGREGPFDSQRLLNFAPFLERYLPFTGSQSWRQNALSWSASAPNIAATKYYETGDPSHLSPVVPRVFFAALHHDSRPIQIDERSSVSAWYNITYKIQYWQPFLRALADADLPLSVSRQESQVFPGGGEIFVRKEDDRDVPLHLNWVARERPMNFEIVSTDGNTCFQQALAAQKRWGEQPLSATWPRDGATGVHRVNVDLQDWRTMLRAPICDLPTVCVIPCDKAGKFYGPQIWYFRTALDQQLLDLRIWSTGRECGIQIRTGDGNERLGQVGLPGAQGRIEAKVEPETIYRFLSTQRGSNANVIQPVGHPLVLARTPEEWFAPTQ